ncbi:MAG: hypothetical protein U0821_19450 [Chloroflexota bacterium]
MAVGAISLESLDEEIKGAEYRRAADTFCRLITDQGESPDRVIHRAIGAAAPFLQVPSHLMKKPDGEIRGVNYDHTILGWRGAIRLMPHMGGPKSVLPIVQAMWYVPQGLNIWEQILCEFPGHYARESEKCNLRYPGPDEEVNRFDGPAWNPPRIHFEDYDPIQQGSAEERLEQLNWAIAEGHRDEAYSLFLGLAADPANRDRLSEQILFAGITDLQDTIIHRGGYQNIGHKALRARAMVDLIDYFGWDRSKELIYTVVPDLGCAPRLYGLWIEINNVAKVEISRLGPIAKRTDRPMTEPELDELANAILWGGPYEVNEAVSRQFRRGSGVLDVADGVAVSYQRYLMDYLEHPSAFSNPMHSFDYLNVVNSWIRKYDNPHQAKAVYMAARFINDAIRYNRLFPRDPKVELAPRREYRPYADAIPVNRLLPVILEATVAQDSPRACALVDSYLERTVERRDLLQTIVYAACHWQNDPHVMRNCTSSIEEFTNNQTTRRDDIIRGFVKHQSRYIKRAPTHDALQLYKQYFDRSATNGNGVH